MEDSKIIEQLSLILTELDARECSNNCPNPLSTVSWGQLCNMGIGLFERLIKKEDCKRVGFGR